MKKIQIIVVILLTINICHAGISKISEADNKKLSIYFKSKKFYIDKIKRNKEILLKEDLYYTTYESNKGNLMRLKKEPFFELETNISKKWLDKILSIYDKGNPILHRMYSLKASRAPAVKEQYKKEFDKFLESLMLIVNNPIPASKELVSKQKQVKKKILEAQIKIWKKYEKILKKKGNKLVDEEGDEIKKEDISSLIDRLKETIRNINNPIKGLE